MRIHHQQCKICNLKNKNFFFQLCLPICKERKKKNKEAQLRKLKGGNVLTKLGIFYCLINGTLALLNSVTEFKFGHIILFLFPSQCPPLIFGSLLLWSNSCCHRDCLRCGSHRVIKAEAAPTFRNRVVR